MKTDKVIDEIVLVFFRAFTEKAKTVREIKLEIKNILEKVDNS